jgi:hypothetical protein
MLDRENKVVLQEIGKEREIDSIRQEIMRHLGVYKYAL